MMLRNQLTIVVSSCEKFSDLWEPNLKFLEQNWKDRNIRTILLTDSLTAFHHKGIEVYSAGEGLEYPERMSRLLPLISTEYILITLDDYFLTKPVKNNSIQRLIHIMDEENLDYIRLFPDPNSKTPYGDYDDLYQIDLDENYSVNLYQSIWRKSFLSSTLKNPISIWEYEVTLSRIAKKQNARCVLSKGNEFSILDVIRKGKILHKAKRRLKKNRVILENREVLPYRTEIKNMLFDTGRKLLPKSGARMVKKLLRRFGVTFISDYARLDSDITESE